MRKKLQETESSQPPITFSFLLGLSLGKQSFGRLESDSGSATNDAKHTSLIQVCFTPDAEMRSILSSYIKKARHNA